MNTKANVLLYILWVILPASFLSADITDAWDATNTSLHDWRVMSFPFDEIFRCAVILDSLNGWVWVHNSQYVYHLKDGQWLLMSEFDGSKLENYFGYFDNFLWFRCLDKINYRYFILQYNETESKRIYPPNADRIRDVCYLSADNIWCACEWGEILHFDGQRWTLFQTPTFMHINQILMLENDTGWILGEAFNQELINFWNGKNWQKIDADFNKGKGWSDVKIKLDASTYYYFGKTDENLLLRLKSSGIESINFSDILKDTLSLNWKIVKNPLVYHRSGSYLTVDLNNYFVEAKGKNEVFFYEMAENKTANAHLLTSDGSLFPTKINYQNIFPRGKAQFTGTRTDRMRGGYGVAFGDFDSDGDDDYYLVDTEDRNNLFLFGGNSTILASSPITFVEAADRLKISGAVILKNGKNVYDMGVCWADIENDGDRDAYITSMYGENELFKNISNRKFEDIAQRANVTGGQARSNVACWGDVNNDGAVDLFVANEDTTNMLFLNDGAGQFREISEKAGLRTAQRGKGATFGDIDNDGDLDLVVTFFGRRNKIYRNMGIDRETKLPRFIDDTDRCLPVNADSLAKSTSAVLADLDNDGDLDLYITNLIFTNRLYQNDGSGIFRDITVAAGVRDSSLSHSSCFFDADNDGDLDFYVTNRGKNLFYLNNGVGKFNQNEDMFELMDQLAYSTGVACGDPDNDGDVDCYLANTDQPSVYFRNDLNNQNYLKIKLIGTKSNRDAIGAKTWLFQAGHLGETDFCLGLRELSGGSGYGCQNSLVIHYGVDATKKYDLKVWFPSGIIKTYQDIEPAQLLTIEEETGIAKAVSLAHKWLIRSIFNRTNQFKFMLTLTILLVLSVVSWLMVHFKKAEPGFAWRLTLIPFAAYFILMALLYGAEFLLADVLPVGFAMLTFGVVFWLLKARTLRIGRERIAEDLLMTCLAFDHGATGTSILNQLQLFCTNLSFDAKNLSANVLRQLQETIIAFYDQVFGALKRICELAKDATVDIYQAEELKRQLISISNYLNDIKVNINLDKNIKKDVWENIYRLVDSVKLNIKAIKGSAMSLLACDAVSLIRNQVARAAKLVHYPIIVNGSAESLPSQVCIKPDELAAIIDNLLQNGHRSMRTCPDPAITIDFKTTDRYLLVNVSDRGEGIPRKYWDRVFERTFTTKTGGKGGFGLYYARHTLAKYGGGIEIVNSRKNRGTVFRINLLII